VIGSRIPELVVAATGAATGAAEYHSSYDLRFLSLPNRYTPMLFFVYYSFLLSVVAASAAASSSSLGPSCCSSAQLTARRNGWIGGVIWYSNYVQP
jgi:hypothetical protein